MATIELSTAPSLLPLFAKAAVLNPLQRRLPGHSSGAALPQSRYTLREQSIDPAHVLAYQRVCGFRVGDVLPPTYLHMLAFPLSVALMTEPDFPFPLIGLVHVANSVTVTRPVRVEETVSLAVHAADLRPHPAGTQLDLLAEASIDGERVWSSRSTYLRRGGSAASAGSAEKGAKDKGAQGKSAQGKGAKKRTAPAPDVPTSLVRVPDDIGRRYAAVSGDRNPIHLYGLTAKLFGFPSAIAHGMWLKARSLAALEGRLPAAMTVDVAFKLPVLLPSTVAIGAQRTGSGWTLDVRNARSGKPHMSGSITA